MHTTGRSQEKTTPTDKYEIKPYVNHLALSAIFPPHQHNEDGRDTWPLPDRQQKALQSFVWTLMDLTIGNLTTSSLTAGNLTTSNHKIFAIM